MKSPAYVYGVTKIYRRLLDERRAATEKELSELQRLFSRSGFTDGYFTEKIGRNMLGVRSEDDKSNSRTRDAFSALTRRRALDMTVTIKAEQPMKMTLSDASRSITVCGDTPMPAINAPLSPENAERNLTKLGATLYRVGRFSLDLDDGLMIPLSRLNDLRRQALTAWEAALAPAQLESAAYQPVKPTQKPTARTTARFYAPRQITRAAQDYFDRIYLPLEKFTPPANGVILPPVIFDDAWEEVRAMLKKAEASGAKYAMVGNLGHLELLRGTDLIPVGDFRFNVTNPEAVARLESLGVLEYILSPELTLPQMRDLSGNKEVIIYGRLPMMTLEKCAIRDIADCNACAKGAVTLRDRKGMEFPILREWEHRNVIYNSLPTCMSERLGELDHAKLSARHFLFSTETPGEVDAVINAHQKRMPLSGTVRRIR
jgi:putative protease